MRVDQKRILIVEDDEGIARVLTDNLRIDGFDVRWAPTAHDALVESQSFRPDLVLLDLMLPGLDGIDVCRQIRTESGVPIVMLTAKSDTVDVVWVSTAPAMPAITAAMV